MAEYLRSVYVSQWPSYASMYFPGRGAPLALGLVIAGHPWFGIWASMVMLSVGSLWMLRAYVSTTLAFAGALLVVLKFAVLSSWVNAYYGGAFAALGGVLVLGAYPRLLIGPRWSVSILLGLGLLILMVTRPFEGFLLSLPIVIALGFTALFRVASHGVAPLVRLALPSLVATSCGLFVLLASNLAVTGNQFTAPYSQNRATYAIAPAFLAAEPNTTPRSMPPQLQAYYEDEARFHRRRETLSGILNAAFKKAATAAQFYLGPVLILPFAVGLFWLVTQRVLIASGALLLVGYLAVTWDWPHYIAPGFGLFLVTAMQGIARLSRWSFHGRPAGLVLSCFLLVVPFVTLVLPSAALYAGAAKPVPQPSLRPCCALVTETNRSKIEAQLLATPGKDLVLARYRPGEEPWITLVANEAEVDRSEIVWAHHLDGPNANLLAYYRGRRLWLVDSIQSTRAIELKR